MVLIFQSKFLKKLLEKSANVLINLGIKTFVWDFRYNSENIKQTEKEHFDNENVLMKKYLNRFKNIEEIVEFYKKYPVILRRILVKTNELINNYELLIDRIEKDFKELELILGEEIIELQILILIGDTHEGGDLILN